MSPVLNILVTFFTPTIQGKPYSLATTAPEVNSDRSLCDYFHEQNIEKNLPCDTSPPSSVTTPESIGK